MAGPLNRLTQVASVTWFGLMGIPQRRGSVAAAVFGIAGVVTVLVGVLSMAAGFRSTLAASGSPDSAIILRSGADSEMSSGLDKETTRVITESPSLARNDRGAIASAELFVIIDLPKRSTGTDANVPLRGVEQQAMAVRDHFKIVQGRAFEPGRNEIMVGSGAASQFAGLDLGKTIKVGRADWLITGIFTAGGGSAESEIWADASVLQDAYERGKTYQAVYAKLTSAAAFDKFKDSLTTDPRLSVKVFRQTEYYADQSSMISKLINSLGTLIAVLMGVGAVFGALNTMYNSVSTRTREIATLRALGFGRSAVTVSVMLESLALALVGGVVGAALAYFVFNGHQTSTMNWQSFSQVTFAFQVTPQLLVGGMIWATGIGMIGGFFPAIRAARLPIASALREL